MLDPEVLIVGGGLAGLWCARRLHEAGISSRVFGASDDVGDVREPTKWTDFFWAEAAKYCYKEPILVLNGEGEGPINNLCVFYMKIYFFISAATEEQ